MKQRFTAMILGAGLSVLATIGCGSDGDSGGATPAETMASCTAWCDAIFAKPCTDPSYTSAAECKTEDCGMSVPAVPANCQGKLKAYYDCLKSQTDICDESGCLAELTVAGNCH